MSVVGDLAAVAAVAALGYFIWQKYDPLKPVADTVADAADKATSQTQKNVAIAKMYAEHPEIIPKAATIGLSSLWSTPIRGVI